jgi:hypothetical protein
LEKYIAALKKGQVVKKNDQSRNVLIINLKPWDIRVKNPDDEVERLQILISAAQCMRFDPFILHMRILIQ